MNGPPPTFAGVLTPSGRGAVATVLVDGPQAVEFVSREFVPALRRLGEELPENKIVFGRWGQVPGEEVVIARRSANKVEIHCHGGVAASAAILRSLVSHGAMIQTWPESLSREESDFIRRSARIGLAQATTERTANILLDQYHGALRRKIDAAKLLVAENDSAAAIAGLEELLRFAPLGLHLTKPWQVVLAGPPNVGKSSLINALVGYDRAIVFDQPGTTRDVVRANTAFDGWPVELADTAGIRPSDDPLETVGVERARQQLTTADCIVLVFDAAQDRKSDEFRLRDDYPQAIVVLNKCDLLSPTSLSQYASAPSPASLLTSTVSGAGLSELQQRIVQHLVPVVPSSGTAVPFTAEQVASLQSAHDSLCGGTIVAARSIDSTW